MSNWVSRSEVGRSDPGEPAEGLAGPEGTWPEREGGDHGIGGLLECYECPLYGWQRW